MLHGSVFGGAQNSHSFDFYSSNLVLILSMGGFAVSHHNLAVISREVEHRISMNALSTNSAAFSV